MEIWSTALSRKSWIKGLPWTSQVICLQCRRPEFDPWIGKITWRRVRQPTPVFLPGESHGQRSLASYSPQDRRVRHKWSDWAPPLLPYFPYIMRSILPPTAWDCPDQSTWTFPGPFLRWLSLWSQENKRSEITLYNAPHGWFPSCYLHPKSFAKWKNPRTSGSDGTLEIL